MSDLVRQLILELLQDTTGPTMRQCATALTALDAEREAHAKEVADLRRRIAELEAQLQDEVIP